LDTGVCAPDESSCPTLSDSNYLCVEASSTCPNASPCAGQYDCGKGICKRTMTEVCPPGKSFYPYNIQKMISQHHLLFLLHIGSSCPGRYYCGDDICSDDPLQCSPPVGIPRPTCANGGVVCKLTEHTTGQDTEDETDETKTPNTTQNTQDVESSSNIVDVCVTLTIVVAFAIFA
jgi:hypothetical protein